jgi:hypothetical protein
VQSVCFGAVQFSDHRRFFYIFIEVADYAICDVTTIIIYRKEVQESVHKQVYGGIFPISCQHFGVGVQFQKISK